MRARAAARADTDEVVIDLRPPEAAPALSDWGAAASAWRRHTFDAYERAHRARPLRPAGFWRRATGLVIDRAALLVVVGLVDTVVWFSVRVLRPEWRDSPRWQLALGLFLLGAVDVGIWYRMVPYAFGTVGATFGMRRAGIVAVEPEDRGPVGATAALLRSLARSILSLVSWGVALVAAAVVLDGGTHRWWTWAGLAVAALVVAGLPQLWSLVDPGRRTIADRLTRTQVVLV